MSLTVKDILEKTFKKSFKGFDEDEVDKFLDEIIDEMKALQGEIASLKNELEAERSHAKKVKETEETIMHTLVSAQKSAERIINEAARKAEIVIANAEMTAKRRSEQTTKDLSEAQGKLTDLKESAASFARSYTEMIRDTLESFEERYRDFFGNAEGGLNARALEKIDEDMAGSLKDVVGAEGRDAEFAQEAPQPEEAEKQPKMDEGGGEEGGAADTELMDDTYAGETKPEEEPEDARQAGTESGPVRLMELNEINKALKEIENGGEDILLDNYEEGGEEKPKPAEAGMDDYSWLYDDEKTGVAFKDPKEKKELESLIDDIME